MAASSCPRIKPIYPVYRLNDRVFRIGAQLGITAEFEDPDGDLWRLVNLLDGRPVDEAVDAVLADSPHLTREDVVEGVRLLDREGFLEEALEDSQGAVASRYLANVSYFSRFLGLDGDRYAPQRTLNDARILLLGLGGGGSNILSLLAGLGPRSVTVVDYDRVEEGNLGRQILYREGDLGRKKSEVAAEALSAMNSSVEVRTVDRRVERVEDVSSLLDDIDIAICAIDEPPFLAQRRVNRAVVDRGVTCVFGASQVSRGRVFTVVPGQTGCFDCLNIHYTRRDPQFVEQFRAFARTGFDPPSIAYGPSVYTLTAMIVDEAVRVLTGYAPPRSLGTQLEVNFEDGTSFQHPSWPRYAEACPACGQGSEEDVEVFRYYAQLG